LKELNILNCEVAIQLEIKENTDRDTMKRCDGSTKSLHDRQRPERLQKSMKFQNRRFLILCKNHIYKIRSDGSKVTSYVIGAVFYDLSCGISLIL
jgi:hypothetical protein